VINGAFRILDEKWNFQSKGYCKNIRCSDRRVLDEDESLVLYNSAYKIGHAVELMFH
jgi:hypothetical protein